jgi:hypothetical protein
LLRVASATGLYNLLKISMRRKFFGEKTYCYLEYSSIYIQ